MALLQEQLGVEANLQVGSSGEFTVLVDDNVVIKKGWLGFPSETKIVAAVAEALQRL